MANLNLDDDLYQFGGFFHFFPKLKGRKYFFHNGKKLVFPWLLLSMEEACHPWAIELVRSPGLIAHNIQKF